MIDGKILISARTLRPALSPWRKSNAMIDSSTRFSRMKRSHRNCHSSAEPRKVSSTAPFPVRLALVGSSVGLATPVFAIGGILRYYYFYMPKSEIGQKIKYLIGIFIGGSGVTLTYNYLIPFLRDHSDFILPFAISNAVASSAWYAVAEYTFGLEAMLGTVSMAQLTAAGIPAELLTFLSNYGIAQLLVGMPFGGAVVGALTALTAQFLWPLAFQLCWSDDMREVLDAKESAWWIDLYNELVFPVMLPISLVAGASIQMLLRPIIIGSAGVPWTSRSLPALALCVGASAAYYISFKSSVDEFFWEERLDVKTGRLISVNFKTKQVLDDNGTAAQHGDVKRGIMSVVRFLHRPLQHLSGQVTQEATKYKLEPGNANSSVRDFALHYGERRKAFQLVDQLVLLQHLEQQCRDITEAQVQRQQQQLALDSQQRKQQPSSRSWGAAAKAVEPPAKAKATVQEARQMSELTEKIKQLKANAVPGGDGENGPNGVGLDLGQVLLWAETAILATSYGEKPASYAHLIESLPPQPLPEGTVMDPCNPPPKTMSEAAKRSEALLAYTNDHLPLLQSELERQIGYEVGAAADDEKRLLAAKGDIAKLAEDNKRKREEELAAVEEAKRNKANAEAMATFVGYMAVLGVVSVMTAVAVGIVGGGGGGGGGSGGRH